MMYFGPVAEAAHGGHSSPLFDLGVGLGVLTLTWVGYFKQSERSNKSVRAAVGISAICGVFLLFGIRELLR